MKNKILVIGSSNTDMIVRVPSIPRPGETIMGSDLLTVPGGKGANQAVAAARAGGNVQFLCCVGDDAFGRQSIEGYIKDGIDTSLIKITKDKPSGVALINVDEKGENSISVAPGANASLLPEDIQKNALAFDTAALVVVQLEIPHSTVEKVVDMAFAAKVPIILNPAPAQALNENILKKLTYLTPNETEAGILSGMPVKEDKMEGIVKYLSNLSKTLILTLGSKGVMFAQQGESTNYKGFKVEAKDTTAAGDVFNGAFAVGLAEGKNITDAIQFAQAAAALSVTKMGAQSSIPDRKAIVAFLAEKAT